MPHKEVDIFVFVTRKLSDDLGKSTFTGRKQSPRYWARFNITICKEQSFFV